MNYFDILLAKKLEDDRDPKVEGLSVSENGRYHEDGVVYDPVIVNVPQTPLSKLTVTENGTYTAPTGTAYNEVEVDVPLPENAYLLKSVSGLPQPIATFSDGANLPMPKLEVGIEPVQSGSGDPSPSNVRPISGWDEVNVSVNGKNLFDMSQAVADANYFAPDGTITHSAYLKVLTMKLLAGTYTISWTPENSSYYVRINELTISKEFVERKITSNDSPQSFTLSADCYIQIVFDYISGTTPAITQIQLELGSTATEYTPYNGHTYTIDLDGTRYGGKVDLVSGVMVVDRAYKSLADSWSVASNGAFYLDGKATDGKAGTVDQMNNILCNMYPKGYCGGAASVAIDHPQTICTQELNGIRFIIYDTSFSDVTAFNTYVASNPIQIVYELATPFTVQLSPTSVISLDVNNVFADSGDILNAEYFSREV